MNAFQVMEYRIHDKLEAGWRLLWSKGHSYPFEQPFLRGDAQYILGVVRASNVVVSCFDVHCREYLGSGT